MSGKRSTTTSLSLRPANKCGRMTLNPALITDIQQIMVDKIKSDPVLQQSIADIVKSNNNSVGDSAESIVALLNPVIETISDKLSEIESKIDDLERYNRTLRFHGFDEEQHENIVNKITNFTNTHLGLNLSTYEIENCHRVGPPRNGYRRSIINSKIFVVEDLTKRTLALFHAARNSVSDAEKKSIVTRNGHVYQKQSDKSLRKITMADIAPKQNKTIHQIIPTSDEFISTSQQDISVLNNTK
ncbi:unnamed protein product [Didymodactylos carnosus]|uniref:Uncharacterized protein n=1 Tax=Didymodactylos carnosus TaxID=1234261 RepID=A0A815YU30_9BILA|nr:unnamed protein product [Didymodactylos carnosus]CAF4440722.1 unnamed protein product [Didymodactylos carnosus]